MVKKVTKKGVYSHGCLFLCLKSLSPDVYLLCVSFSLDIETLSVLQIFCQTSQKEYFKIFLLTQEISLPSPIPPPW